MTAIDEDEASELSVILAELEEVLPADVRATLRPPARPSDLAALAASIPEAGQLPADLRALLTWHDGQSWNSPLSRKNNCRLLSASEVVNECLFFADPMSDFVEPWNASWLPVLTNDSGDFVVYETADLSKGKLLRYWHDNQSRSVAYSSLLQWATGLLREYEQSDA